MKSQILSSSVIAFGDHIILAIGSIVFWLRLD